MNGFVFPDDLRYRDIILVADKSEVEAVLRAFQELGWKWVDGQDLICGLNHLVNVLGFSVWNDKTLGWIDRSVPAEILCSMYKRFFNASDVIPNLKSDLPDELPAVDLREFLE